MLKKRLNAKGSKLFPLVLMTSLLTGCVGMDTSQLNWSEDVIPQTWNALKQVQSTEQQYTVESRQSFWAQWNDPYLNELQERALKVNDDIQVAMSALQESLALVDVKRALRLPGGEASVSTSHTHANHVSTDASKAQIGANWSINLMGAEYYAQKAQALQAVSSQWALNAVQQQVLNQVAQSYIQYALAKEQIQLLDQMIATQQKSLDVVLSKVRAGLAPYSDLAIAQSQVSELQGRRPQYEMSADKALNVLVRLTHVPAQTIAANAKVTIPTAPQTFEAEMPAQVLNHRPDLLMQKFKVKAAIEQVSEAQAQFYPSLNLAGTFGTTGSTLSALGVAGSGITNLVGALNVPIFNWYRLAQQEKGAKAKVNSALAQYGKTLVLALEDVENSISELNHTKDEIRLNEVAIMRLNEAVDYTKSEYDAGVGDYIRYLTTIRSYQNVQDKVLRLKAQLANATIELYRATGGNWAHSEQDKQGDK